MSMRKASLSSLSQIGGLLNTLIQPGFQLFAISRDKSDFEWLGLRHHACWDRIALDSIKIGPTFGIVCGLDMECQYQSSENGIQLTVGKMGSSTHAGSSSISVMLSSRTRFVDAHETVRVKLHGISELFRVMVGGPHVLQQIELK